MAAALAAAAGGVFLPEGPAQAQAYRRGESQPAATGSQPPAAGGALQLRVRRTPDAVELMIEGTGAAPQLQQAESASGWQGQLFTASPTGLRVGPQRISMPEVGFQTISFDGAGSVYTISVTPAPGISLGRPVVSADGRNMILTFASPVPQARLQTNRINMAQPGAVPLPTYAPPLQPRAVAPPLGDMAVGTMVMRSPGFLNVSGPPVTMTLRNAPAKDALMALAQLGGYGFAYVEEPIDGTAQGQQPLLSPGSRPISVAFRNESYSTAINTTLLSAGLQGRREGNVIFAGPGALGVGIGPQVSRVYRLNQVSPADAARYLANLGATVVRTKIERTSSTEGIANAAVVFGSTASQTTASTETVSVEEFGASRGPLLGLRATTDDRLGTITMVGSPDIVSFGEQYLKQLDLRQRQVALRVQILDVNLDNVSEIDNSFAFRFGNNFIVNNSGELLGAFGRNLPPSADSFQRRSPESIEVEIGPDGARFDLENPPPNLRVFAEGRLDGSRNAGDLRTGSTVPNPGVNYPDNEFFNFVRAQITSGSTKLLASPTLILQENTSLLRDRGSQSVFQGDNQGLGQFDIDSPIGRARANEGVVRVGTNVVTNYETESPEGGGNVVCTPVLSTAGLVLGARVEKIDDNGFVTFTLSPSVSAVTGQEPSPPACGSPLNILSVRSLDTGALRVRDGQTLIMTGVISEFDRSVVSKWPIFGDIPIIGQFFRSTGRTREKRELVIMVTPRIINDEEGGLYGYGYQPSTNEARDLFGSTLQPPQPPSRR